jgi:hypothetical protein
MHLPGRPYKRARRAVLRWLQRLSPAPDEPPRAIPIRTHADRYLQGLVLLMKRRPELEIRIACAGRIDGVGRQALCVISALAFAHRHRCRYLHTPFSNVAHAEGDAAAWAARWETFLGLGYGEATLPADAELVPIKGFLAAHRRDRRHAHSPRAVVLSGNFGLGEIVDTRCWLLPQVRAKYQASDKSVVPLFREAGAINVAVHVRRGDVAARNPRHVPDAAVLRTIARVRAVIASNGQEAAIHLFSDGTPAQFAVYSDAGCALHLGADPFVTFHNLVAADLLVSAPSAFSHLAALLSEGIVLNPNDQWELGKRWLPLSLDGAFDTAQLAEALARPA